MKIKTLLFLSLFFLAKANAAACWNSNGTPTDVSYDLTATLTSAQNKTGATYQLTKSQQIAVNARCPENESTDNTTYRSYLSMEGANKQVISSQADSLIKISRIWADFFPANTSNQPI